MGSSEVQFHVHRPGEAGERNKCAGIEKIGVPG
jgi:hypothetical protein